MKLKTKIQSGIIAVLLAIFGSSALTNLGGTQPIAGSTYNLAGSGISGSATSITLQKLTLPQTGQELVDSDFSDTFYVTLEPGNKTRQEIASCTTVTQGAGTTATLSGCSRGLSPIPPYTASTTLQFSHAGGSQVIFSDAPQLFNEYTAKGNTEAISGQWTFSILPESSVAPTTTVQFTNKAYVDAGFNQGAATSTEAVGGISELATKAEQAAGAALVADAPLVLGAHYASSTPGVNASATNTVVVSESDAKLNLLWLDLTEEFAFLGGMTANQATSTELVIGSTVPTSELTTGDLWVGNNLYVTGTLKFPLPQYYGDGSDGALTVTAADFFPNNASSTLAVAAATSTQSITLTDVSSFATSTKVFIHSARGENVGNWEINTISAKDNGLNTLTLSDANKNAYKNTTGADITQVLKVPQYTSVTFKGSGGISPFEHWTAGDTTVGGVVVFYASEGVVIETGTTLTLTGMGFKGALVSGQGEGTDGAGGTVSTAANGNGGGAGATTNVGIGGLNLVDDQATVFTETGMKIILGGGGGSGSNFDVGFGGDGGGIFMPITPSYVNFGTVVVSGAAGTSEVEGNRGGGGGGGAGAVIAFAEQIFEGTNTVTGGAGGSGQGSGHYGGGGGGNKATGASASTITGGVGAVGFFMQGIVDGALPGN